MKSHMFQKLRQFILEARQELKRVNWPTRQETVRLTTVVVILSVAISLLLGVFDYLFIYGLRLILKT